MKKILLLVVLFCASLMTMAQDVIVKKDGTTVLGKVEEINSTEIKYRKWSNLDGPLYSINCSEVTSINFQNGDVEKITSATNRKSGWMERDGSNLILNGRMIYGEEIRWLVGEQNYQTYLSAKKQIVAGRVFTVVFFASLGTTVGLAISGKSQAAIISGSVADVSLALLCVFKGVGKGRMNWVADEYNRSASASAFSYQISPSIMKSNSMESQNNLGIGMTFSLNF